MRYVTGMNQACHTSHVWMSHVSHMLSHVWYMIVARLTYEQVVSYITYEWVMSHIRMSHVTHTNESCHTYEWVVSHIRMSHVTHMSESCLISEQVMSHIWTSHVSHMNESCLKYEWVMSHIWISHVTHVNESCPTYNWVMSHIWMSHVPQMNESRHTYIWVMAHIWMSHATRSNESCHTYEWVMPHIQVCHVTRTHAPCHTHERLESHFFWWVLQHCTGFARLVWGTLRVHRAFIYSDWFVCSVCFCSLLPRLTLFLSFLDILHCLPRAVGVPLESALNLVSPMSPCGWHDEWLELQVIHECVTQVMTHSCVCHDSFYSLYKRDYILRKRPMLHECVTQVIHECVPPCTVLHVCLKAFMNV